MAKYRVFFEGKNGGRYFIECETRRRAVAIMAEEKAEGSTFIRIEEMKKKSVVYSIFFLAVAILAILTDGNIAVFAVCLSLAWLTLTADIKRTISKIMRLEA